MVFWLPFCKNVFNKLASTICAYTNLIKRTSVLLNYMITLKKKLVTKCKIVHGYTVYILQTKLQQNS